MPKKVRKSAFQPSGDDRALREHLYDMEPHFRMLEGVVATLRALATTADMVEPIALAALAHLSGESLEKVVSAWRLAHESLNRHSKHGAPV